MAARLTHKERGFVKDIAKGETGVQAALNNYDTTDYSTAGAIASENLKKPKIINALEEALPDELLAQVHREGLFATKPTYNDENEMIGEDADFNVRHKYLDSAYKLKGKYAAEKHLNMNVDIEVSPEISALTKKLNDVYRQNDENKAI